MAKFSHEDAFPVFRQKITQQSSDFSKEFEREKMHGGYAYRPSQIS